MTISVKATDFAAATDNLSLAKLVAKMQLEDILDRTQREIDRDKTAEEHRVAIIASYAASQALVMQQNVLYKQLIEQPVETPAPAGPNIQQQMAREFFRMWLDVRKTTLSATTTDPNLADLVRDVQFMTNAGLKDYLDMLNGLT